MALRSIVISLLTAIIAGGETLQVLVLEIDKRYTPPAYERALGDDPDAFQEAVTKLRELTPEQGVREWIHLEIPRDDPEKRVLTEAMRYEDTPREKKRTRIGHKHLWYRTGDRLVNRTLELNAVLDKSRLLRLRCGFHHQIDDKWSLSAAMTGATGTLLVLEKLVEAKTTPRKPRWLFSVLHSKKPGRTGRSSVVDALIDPPLGRAALLRVPDPGVTLTAIASLDLAQDTDYMEGYSKDLVSFSANAATDNPQLKLKLPIRSSVQFERLDSIGIKSTVSHHGNFAMPMEEPVTGREFEVLQRDNHRSGTTTHSVPSKKKPSYYLDSRLVPVD